MVSKLKRDSTRVELVLHALDSRIGLEIEVIGDIEESLLTFALSKTFSLNILALVGSVDSGDRLEKRCFARAVVADKPVY